MDLSVLPTLNAALNATTAVLLSAGYIFIRRRRVRWHRAAMLGAFGASALFLASYLIYHAQAGMTRFAGTGWVRPFYFAVLVSHTTLAVVIVPLAIITVSRALRRQFQRHRRIARWTLPLWLYVAVTGSAVIYVMLYVLYPSR